MGLPTARTAPVGRQILERDAVVLGGIVHIAADGADVLSCRRLEHDFAWRNDGGRVREIYDALRLEDFQRFRRVRAEPNSRTRSTERTAAVVSAIVAMLNARSVRLISGFLLGVKKKTLRFLPDKKTQIGKECSKPDDPAWTGDCA